MNPNAIKMCLSHINLLCVWPSVQQGCHAVFHQKSKQFSLRCNTTPPPSVFNTFQIDFSSHVNCMKCANQRLQIDIVLRLSSSTAKNKVKFTIRHSYAPKSIGDYTQNIV